MSGSRPFWPMAHLLKKYPMAHFAMLTPHGQLFKIVLRSANSRAGV